MAEDRRDGDVPPQVLQYLRQHETVTVASVSPSGMPHAATMIYADDGLVLYFCTSPDSRTAHYVAQNPRVAFTIDEYAADWRRITGIQGAGECRPLLDSEEIRQVTQLFQRKFAALADQPEGFSSFSRLTFFRILPSDLEYIDRAGATGTTSQALGMDYHKNLVYSVFRNLPRQEVDAISGQLHTLSFDTGEIIVRQGAPADKFFVIVDGEVAVLRDDGEGAVPVATLRRGQFFGEIAILQDTPRTATVRAASPVSLLTMDRDVFRSLVAQSLSTTQDFDRVIRDRRTALARQPEP